MANKPIQTPMDAPRPSKKAGGVYNGEKGLPPRTKTPNGPPEKVRESI
jgi:hypothetical protein